MSTNIRTNSIHQLLPLNYKANQKPQAIKPNIKYTTHHIKKDKEKKIGPTILGFILRKQWPSNGQALGVKSVSPWNSLWHIQLFVVNTGHGIMKHLDQMYHQSLCSQSCYLLQVISSTDCDWTKDMSPKLLLWLVNVYISKLLLSQSYQPYFCFPTCYDVFDHHSIIAWRAAVLSFHFRIG